jgi:hypothetical protein
MNLKTDTSLKFAGWLRDLADVVEKENISHVDIDEGIQIEEKRPEPGDARIIRKPTGWKTIKIQYHKVDDGSEV